MGKKKYVVDEYEEKEKILLQNDDEISEDDSEELTIAEYEELDNDFDSFVYDLHQLLNNFRKEMSLPLCEYLTVETLDQFIENNIIF